MANSGYFYTSGYYDEGWPYRWLFEWTLQSQSVDGNYSVISWTLKGDGAYNDSRYTVVSASYVNVNGEEQSSSTSQNVHNGTVRHSGTTTIYHNADGTKSFSASAKGAFYYNYYNTSGSDTFELPTIARASGVSCSTADIGSDATITISRASSSFTHTLTYDFFGLTGTIATKTTQTSVKFTLPETFYAKIPNLKFGKGIIICTTYNGNTVIGTTKCPMQANCNEVKCQPAMSTKCYDSNTTTVALTGDNSKFVKYYSNVTVKANAVAKNSATLKSQSITIGSKTINSGSGTINAVEDGVVKFIAKDSRGFTRQINSYQTLIAYVKLTCAIKAGAATTSGVAQLSVSGNYWNGNFGAVANTLTIQYRYMVQGGTFTEWQNANSNITKSNNTYDTTISISGLDYRNTYVFQARAIDKLATVSSARDSSKTVPVWDWGKDSFNINGDLTINNGSLADYAETKLNWGKNTVSYASETKSVANDATVNGAKITLADNSRYLVLCGVMSESGSQAAFSDIIVAGINTNGTKLIETVGRGPAYAGGGTTGWAIVETGTNNYVQTYTYGYRSATSNYYFRTVAIRLDK